MNKKMIIITSEALRDIFLVSGFEQHTVTDLKNADEIIYEKIKDERVGVILIEEELYKNLSSKARFMMERKWEGIVVRIPSFKEFETEDSYILNEIRRVLGYQIKIT